MIGAGRLRDAATVLRPTRNALGQAVSFASSGLEFRCSFQEESAVEQSVGGGTAAVKSISVVCRWDAIVECSLTSHDRLSIDVNGTTRVVAIRGIVNMYNANRRAELDCVEVSP